MAAFVISKAKFFFYPVQVPYDFVCCDCMYKATQRISFSKVISPVLSN